MYYIVKIIKTKDGFRPKLKRKVTFLLLAEPNSEAKYGLYEISKLKELTKAIKKLDKELIELIDSAKGYPPALALAREQIRNAVKRKYGNDFNKSNFLQEFSWLLKHHLENQKESRYFLAECLKEQIGYLRLNSFYWIIGWNSIQKLIFWVSDDYFIYQDSFEVFNLDESFLKHRFS
mgnify:CR=1 FL=1